MRGIVRVLLLPLLSFRGVLFSLLFFFFSRRWSFIPPICKTVLPRPAALFLSGILPLISPHARGSSLQSLFYVMICPLAFSGSRADLLSTRKFQPGAISGLSYNISIFSSLFCSLLLGTPLQKFFFFRRTVFDYSGFLPLIPSIHYVSVTLLWTNHSRLSGPFPE